MSMTSSRPYFIRALYEWIVDNNCTPHILVDAHIEGTRVPQQHVNKDGQIILNIAPSAVSDFVMDNLTLSFSARFGGVANHLFIPCHAILGIYARENGRGMMFEPEEAPKPPTPPAPAPAPSPARDIKSATKRPGLRVVK
ncbi:ClpXP protease specificity-enhancing factor [Cellvibrio japonicus]|uniref:Stringent starvation protein B n=1 Tax=Cellvibrio japonicus (strain Ueda107) TaxID=498211 RepID=B3PBL6_CELJU|nr:ClpXP protease specificity-enhancing factor [Cellvibrio japonicus]ACE82851.1 stringent starvation protein B [Cellvibrio japonicus Ueda107]QEI13129.1 ClpXP protease specificity-enhancing factor [Cellvibrio japonicus]QEI16703.1 ClpXP protease specificity-enhancing factor [Cellvibrio japonicus]QEI20281.1 ClpXP protease specificity-enhancing factor [Cellvibrio japonicus]